jgi:hypothetical protein
MFRPVLLTIVIAFVPVLAQAGGPKDELIAAVKKLADSPNYSWTTKVEGGFSAGSGEGKTEKDGATSLAVMLGDDSYQVIIKGDKAAAKGNGGWASLAELNRDAEEEGTGFSPERFLAASIEHFKSPAAQAKDVCDEIDEVQESGDVFKADLKPDTIKKLLSFLRRRAVAANPAQIEVKDPKGTASFWVRDGVLAKMEVHLQGAVKFNSNERTIDRTTITTIKDIGSTKVIVPEESRAKL